jgi:cobalamin biosynthesis protein CobT
VESELRHLQRGSGRGRRRSLRRRLDAFEHFFALEVGVFENDRLHRVVLEPMMLNVFIRH